LRNPWRGYDPVMPLGSKRSHDEPRDDPRAPTGAGGTPAPTAPEPAGAGGRTAPSGGRDQPRTMLPARSKRSAVEAGFMRFVATAGIVGICVVIAAIMGSSDVQGWIIGLVVSLISVVLAGVLWSSRRL
jgi:hypothetical protein